jgi:hypothetical protein
MKKTQKRRGYGNSKKKKKKIQKQGSKDPLALHVDFKPY